MAGFTSRRFDFVGISHLVKAGLLVQKLFYELSGDVLTTDRISFANRASRVAKSGRTDPPVPWTGPGLRAREEVCRKYVGQKKPFLTFINGRTRPVAR